MAWRRTNGWLTSMPKCAVSIRGSAFRNGQKSNSSMVRTPFTASALLPFCGDSSGGRNDYLRGNSITFPDAIVKVQRELAHWPEPEIAVKSPADGTVAGRWPAQDYWRQQPTANDPGPSLSGQGDRWESETGAICGIHRPISARFSATFWKGFGDSPIPLLSHQKRPKARPPPSEIGRASCRERV